MGCRLATVDSYIRVGHRFYIPGLTAQNRDQILVTLWFIVTFKQFPKDELILYPLALYFAYAFVRDFNKLFPILTHGAWVLFLFPVWCTISVLWGAETGLIIKSSMQLYLTVIICFCAAFRLERRQLIMSFMIAAGILGFLSQFFPPGSPQRGVFSSKNAMGLSMVMLWLSSLCVALDPKQHLRNRIIAGFLAVLAINLVFVANSATAVLLAFGLLLVVLFGVLIRGRGLFHPRVLLTLCLGTGAIFIFGAIVLSASSIDVLGLILEKFGKDATLTGRTILWGYAFDLIHENPLLGLGTGGFWRPYDWTSLSRKIFIDFYINLSGTFYFHNSYLEVAVHQGLIGLAIALSAFFFAIWQVVSATWRNPDMPQIFFVALATMMFIRNMTEPGLMSSFSLMTMVLYMGAVMSVREKVGIDPTKV